MLLNSCQPWIKQEFQSEHPRKRKIKSKHVHSSTSSPTHKQNTASHTDRHPWMNRMCMLPKKPSQVPSERFKWLQVPFPFSSVGYVWGGNAPTALYLSNKLCAIKPTCLLSILKCILKSPFTNLRDRNKFMNWEMKAQNMTQKLKSTLKSSFHLHPRSCWVRTAHRKVR